MKRTFFLTILLLAASTVTSKEPYGIKRMREYFKKEIPNAPYIFLQTPRSALGVGTIFTVIDGQNFFYSRPEDCFSTEVLKKANNPSDEIILPEGTITAQYDWKIGLGVANAGAITEEVKAEFENNHVSTMTLTIGHLKRSLLSLRDLQAAIRNQMDLDCKNAFIAGRSERWLIVEALYTDSFSLAFQDKTTRNVSVSAKILKVLFPSFKSSKEGTGRGTLQFSGGNYIVAIKAKKIGDRTKYAGGDVPTVDLDPDEYYMLVERWLSQGNLR
jgi:hypothetical protein